MGRWFSTRPLTFARRWQKAKSMKMLTGRFQVLGATLSMGAVGLLLMSGCGKQIESTSNSFQQVYDASFSTTCMNCHTPGGSSGTTVDFTNADTAYNSLVSQNVQSPSNPSTCGGVKRVAPGDATNSYLMGVLFAQDNRNNFGGSTNCQPPTSHLSQVSLSDSERSNIQSWINSGAAR